MINGFDQLSKEQLILLLTTLWAIWHSRNKKLFANSDLTPVDIVAWINSFISDYQEAMCNINRYRAVQTLQVSGREKTVSQNCYQLSTDAALSVEQSKMGFRAVIQDWQGNLVAGLSIPAIGNLQPLMAEALSLRASLMWCQNIHITLAVVETDSKLLVDKVHSQKNDRSTLSDVVEDIRSSLSAFPNVDLRQFPSKKIHVFRLSQMSYASPVNAV
ncbi:uncharacterized protein LOC133034094 [Cannabis sativa]|uniref:uncharacterized protein LOC133034094 n=1 Tax=Cannabis sativa TaxID=3483 RepID=UPI0029CA96A3|nr:uncharacterized protein LOC133034094 [Cannabis sativa]